MRDHKRWLLSTVSHYPIALPEPNLLNCVLAAMVSSPKTKALVEARYRRKR